MSVSESFPPAHRRTVTWVDPRTANAQEVDVVAEGIEDARAAVAAAVAAAPVLAAMAPEDKARLLLAVADALEAADLVPLAAAETALPEARLVGEMKRTVHQLRYLAEETITGAFLDATIDLADPETPLGAVPDLRRVGVPLGPVVIFAASNFPFAFSVLGGDTATALAAGCPVVVKAHPGHPRLSEAMRDVAVAALTSAGAPTGTLCVVHGVEAGVALVAAPDIRAVAFTGSREAGRLLHDQAKGRSDPIPFFGELGSVNPVVVTPGAAAERGPAITEGFLDSVALGHGQFCTSPGVLFVPEGSELIGELAAKVTHLPSGTMLTSSIRDGLGRHRDSLVHHQSVGVLGAGQSDGSGLTASVELFRTDIAALDADPTLLTTERFGPVALIVEYTDPDSVLRVLSGLGGSLTFCFHTTSEESDLAERYLRAAARWAGRLVIDGWPTGVAVRRAMHHGGPYPAATERFSSVGGNSLHRFVTPVCYQGVPDSLLPPPLRNANPWGVVRRVDGDLTTEPIEPDTPSWGDRRLTRTITTADAPPPAGSYSPGVCSGGFLFISGQGPFDLEGVKRPGTFEEEARRTFDNLAAIAEAAGASLHDAVRVGVYLSTMGNFAELSDIMRPYFGDRLPARTTVPVALNGFQIEVDAIIRLPPEHPNGAS